MCMYIKIWVWGLALLYLHSKSYSTCSSRLTSSNFQYFSCICGDNILPSSVDRRFPIFCPPCFLWGLFLVFISQCDHPVACSFLSFIYCLLMVIITNILIISYFHFQFLYMGPRLHFWNFWIPLHGNTQFVHNFSFLISFPTLQNILVFYTKLNF